MFLILMGPSIGLGLVNSLQNGAVFLPGASHTSHVLKNWQTFTVLENPVSSEAITTISCCVGSGCFPTSSFFDSGSTQSPTAQTSRLRQRKWSPTARIDCSR